jgi:hypothetical protein
VEGEEMTTKELAKILNNSQYRMYVSPEIKQEAENSGLVIVYGQSDDLMEFRGAIDEELGAYGGTTELIDKEGLLIEYEYDKFEDDELLRYLTRKKTAQTIEALWCKEDKLSWTFKTEIPHETFMILDEGEPYCRGIVFALDDVK